MTVRLKLTMAFIAVVFVANALLSLFTVKHFGQVWLGEVQSRVRLDLNSAREAYHNHIKGIARFLEATVLDERIADALRDDDLWELERLLGVAYQRGGMDMLTAVAPTGQVRLRVHAPAQRGDDVWDNPLISAAIAQKTPVWGTVVLSRKELELEGGNLTTRARFMLLPTPAAKPTEEEFRTDGMVVAAVVPIFDSEGQLLGVLYGGDLLNRCYEIVDQIKAEVFGRQIFEGREVGTVTIFQDDLRVSTNVTHEDGTRAVGTRLSQEVYDKVLKQGEVWEDRAFVVNDWYITAYEPIRDPTDRVIGALYVGQLEAPFLHQEQTIVGTFLLMMSLTTVTSLVLLFFVTMLVLRPIGRIITMSRKVIRGDMTARVDIRPPGEMGRLCQAINAMADAVSLREAQLKLATRKHIGRAEKLASVGRLSAGIAHEINNPLTGILTFAHLLRDKENMTVEDKSDIQVIISETTRVSEIVSGLLDFARERPSQKESLDINQVVERTLRLVSSQKQMERVTVLQDLASDLPPVNGDANQLEQVLLNLALNAMEAMPGGGTLEIRTLARGSRVVITVRDTGCGIKDEHLDEVFEPFFTTKAVGTGTGLGLSVSYGIIEQHDGNLEVESEEGKGTMIKIILPASEDEAAGANGEEVN